MTSVIVDYHSNLATSSMLERKAFRIDPLQVFRMPGAGRNSSSIRHSESNARSLAVTAGLASSKPVIGQLSQFTECTSFVSSSAQLLASVVVATTEKPTTDPQNRRKDVVINKSELYTSARNTKHAGKQIQIRKSASQTDTSIHSGSKSDKPDSSCQRTISAIEVGVSILSFVSVCASIFGGVMCLLTQRDVSMEVERRSKLSRWGLSIDIFGRLGTTGQSLGRCDRSFSVLKGNRTAMC